jgi:hypothetical protein
MKIATFPFPNSINFTWTVLLLIELCYCMLKYHKKGDKMPVLEAYCAGTEPSIKAVILEQMSFSTARASGCAG